nr:hypothetical protein CFP56_24474 [Quercus suber]
MSRNQSFGSFVSSATGRADRSAPFHLPPFDLANSAVESAQELSLAAGRNGKKSRSTKIRPPRPISQSASAVQLGLPAMSESELEKKRNKLGYQRISIACAHCRRRKIRCVIEDNDPQGRCQNCIRLKKECVFYPVDQQSAIDNRSQAPTLTPAGSGSASVVSSSPNNSTSKSLHEGSGDFNGYHIPPSASDSFHSLTMETGEFAEPDVMYSSPLETRQPWGSTGSFDGGPSSAGAPPPVHGYWRGPEPSSSGGDYASYPSNPDQHYPHHIYTPNIDYGQRGGQNWQASQPAGRTMSYGMPDSVPSQPLHSYSGPVSPETQRRPSHTPFPPVPSPLDVRGAAVVGHGRGPHSAPIGAPTTQFDQPEAYMYNHNQAHYLPHQHSWYPGQPDAESVNGTSSHDSQAQYPSLLRHPK